MLIKELESKQPIFILEFDERYKLSMKEYQNSNFIPKEYLEKEIKDLKVEVDGVEIWV